jgi:tRNA dimethylallyltransferase
MTNNYLLVIAGPTAVGKTKLSIEVAKHFNTEIVSADSRQIFKEMNIGTAVPDKNELSQIKHHFIQVKSIRENFNASKFEFEALKLLEKLFKTHHIVLLTGGSGLYIDAVCKGIDEFPETDQRLRNELLRKLETEGIESLRKELKFLDPVSYSELDLKNPKRIQKAIEISLMTGKPYSSFLTGSAKKRPFRIIKTGLNMSREKLYERINHRSLEMFDNGLEEEARGLYPLRQYNSLNTVGYRELFDYFDGKISREEAKEKIQANTRKYARKQITWFRKNNEYTWFDPENKNGLIQFVEKFLTTEVKRH